MKKASVCDNFDSIRLTSTRHIDFIFHIFALKNPKYPDTPKSLRNNPKLGLMALIWSPLIVAGRFGVTLLRFKGRVISRGECPLVGVVLRVNNLCV